MRRTRLSFKYAIRQVKRNEDRARADALATDLESKNDKSFWKNVSKINRKHLPLPNVLNGCNDNGRNGRNGSCLTWLATSFEEKRRWLIINASPRGQCSK